MSKSSIPDTQDDRYKHIMKLIHDRLDHQIQTNRHKYSTDEEKAEKLKIGERDAKLIITALRDFVGLVTECQDRKVCGISIVPANIPQLEKAYQVYCDAVNELILLRARQASEDEIDNVNLKYFVKMYDVLS